MSPRLIRLTERVPHVVHLRRDDVDCLLARHRNHVAVDPTGSPGRYRLTSLGFAGVIATPSCRFALRPKLPAANLAILLDPLSPPLAIADTAAAVAGDHLLDLLAGRLAQLLAERLDRGLHRDYVERAEAAAYLRGRLDVAAKVHDTNPRRDRLHSRYDEHTADIPCNQLPKAVVAVLLARADLDERVRAPLTGLLRGYSEVTPVGLTPELWSATETAPRAEGYGPLLDLCRLIANGLTTGERHGAAAGPTFLIDLGRVFERYVTTAVASALADRPRLQARVQPFQLVSPAALGQPDLHLRPDVLIEYDGQPRLVLDVKWKRLSRVALPTDDVYQVLAYAAALGLPHAVLVYPGPRDRRWVYPLAKPGPELEVWTLRVVGPREACDRSRCRLGQRLRRLVG